MREELFKIPPECPYCHGQTKWQFRMGKLTVQCLECQSWYNHKPDDPLYIFAFRMSDFMDNFQDELNKRIGVLCPN